MKNLPLFKGLLHKLSEDQQPRHEYRYAYQGYLLTVKAFLNVMSSYRLKTGQFLPGWSSESGTEASR
jgi:hypothetical protein